MQVLASPPRQTDRGRAFLSDHPVESTLVDGRPVLLVAVRLPSYRSLPLSCIDSVSLSIDGTPVDADRLELIVGGRAFPVNDLGTHSRVWWFVLEVAWLRCRLDRAPAGSEASVRGELVTVEPYISNGRFLFAYESERTLEVVAAHQDAVRRG